MKEVVLKDNRYAVVIPAHNEQNTIRQVVIGVLQYTDHVIVVDDGSSDNTANAINDLPIKILSHSTNKGKTASLLTGFKAALSYDIDGVVTMDADLQHAPDFLPKLFHVSKTHKNAVIIAARLLDKQNRPKKSVIGNVIADFFIAWATKKIIIDTQSGYRYYPIKLLRNIDLNIHYKSCFILETYLLVAATRQKFDVISIPCKAIYPKDIRPSHYKPWRHTLPIVFMLTWYIIRHGLIPTGFIKSVSYYYKQYIEYKKHGK